MKKYRTQLLLIIFISLLTLNLYSQNEFINDDYTATQLNEIAEKNLSTNPDRSLEIAFSASRIAKENDDLHQLAYSQRILGKLYRRQADYEKAEQYYTKSINNYHAIENNESQAIALRGLGIVYYYKGDYAKAIAAYHNSLSIFEKINDNNEIVKSLNNIGVVYDEMGEVDKALEYYEQVLKLVDKVSNKKGIAAAFNNIGNIYYYNGDTNQAIAFFNKSLKIKEKDKDYKGMANTYTNIGNIYLEEKNYKNAMNYYILALQIEKANGYKENLISTMILVGQLHEKKNEYDDALKFYKISENLADSLDSNPKRIKVYEALSDLYTQTKKYELALDYKSRQLKVRKQLLDEEKYKKIAEMEIKYQVYDSEKKIELYQIQQDKQKLYMIIAIVGILFLITFLAFVYYQFRNKKRLNEKLEIKNDEIREKSERVIEQRDQITEQKKEMTDSIQYASRIQTSLLPLDEDIKKSLPNSFVLNKPRDIVSGDFHWFLRIGNKIIITAVDCTGHGVPGAFMSMLGVTFLNEIVSSVNNNINTLTAANILNQLREKVKKALRQKDSEHGAKDGMDMSLCIIDADKTTVQYAGANNPLYYISKGGKNESSEKFADRYKVHNDAKSGEYKLFEIKADKMPIGIHMKDESQKFVNHTIILDKGDSIYLFSDGYADQFGGAKGKKFKYSQLRKLLINIFDKSPDEQKLVLENEMKMWKGELSQIDDILIIGIKL